MTNQDNRSDLQQSIDARLRAQAAEKVNPTAKPVDGVEDSSFIDGTKKTSPLFAVWISIVVIAIVLLGVMIYWMNR